MGLVNEIKLSLLKHEELADKVIAGEEKKVTVTKEKLIDEIGKKLLCMSPGSKARLFEKIQERKSKFNESLKTIDSNRHKTVSPHSNIVKRDL